jgi:molybdenum-dependent DNA-binding transcriptional regulator ModE
MLLQMLYRLRIIRKVGTLRMSHSENLNYFSLRELKVLVTVAEFGTISGAATKLGRSQAAVSTAISQIEARLGLQLFVRKPAKGLFTTSSGAVIVLEARGLLAHADEFAMVNLTSPAQRDVATFEDSPCLIKTRGAPPHRTDLPGLINVIL